MTRRTVVRRRRSSSPFLSSRRSPLLSRAYLVKKTARRKGVSDWPDRRRPSPSRVAAVRRRPCGGRVMARPPVATHPTSAAGGRAKRDTRRRHSGVIGRPRSTSYPQRPRSVGVRGLFFGGGKTRRVPGEYVYYIFGIVISRVPRLLSKHYCPPLFDAYDGRSSVGRFPENRVHYRCRLLQKNQKSTRGFSWGHLGFARTERVGFFDDVPRTTVSEKQNKNISSKIGFPAGVQVLNCEIGRPRVLK